MFKKRYDDKEIECSFCHTRVKPLLERMNVNLGYGSSFPGLIGRVGSGLVKEKKYLLICPHCKAVIGRK